MDSIDRPAHELKLDPELLGHDHELASAVQLLERQATLRAGSMGVAVHRTIAVGPGPAPVGSARSEDDESSPDAPRGARLPSGFFTRALPMYGTLAERARLPLRAFLVVGAVTVSLSTAVAWGMVYLLKPGAFSRTSPTAPSARIESPRVLTSTPLAIARPASVEGTTVVTQVRAEPPETTTPSELEHVTEQNVTGRTARVRPHGLPVVAPATTAAASTSQPGRKAWFE